MSGNNHDGKNSYSSFTGSFGTSDDFSKQQNPSQNKVIDSFRNANQYETHEMKVREEAMAREQQESQSVKIEPQVKLSKQGQSVMKAINERVKLAQDMTPGSLKDENRYPPVQTSKQKIVGFIKKTLGWEKS